MLRAYIISLILIAILVGILADWQPDTAAELYPVASSIGWVEGHGRALKPDLIGQGIRPAHVVKIGTSILPRTSPVMMLHYSAVCRIYRDAVGRSPDGADIPRLSWWIQFAGVLPWALLLFGGLYRLAGLWGKIDGMKRIWAVWAAIAGSLAFGWFGVMSPYLPVAALSCWTVALVFGSEKSKSPAPLIIAGLLAGLSGGWHPTGWVWIVWGLFFLFVASSSGSSPSRQTLSAVSFGIAAAVGVVFVLIGNYVFFGNPLPVQWIDLQPVRMNIGELVSLCWHNSFGWNGIFWLSPLVLAGFFAFRWKPDEVTGGEIGVFLIGVIAVVLFTWGIADDARLTGEIENIRPEFQVLPVELVDGEFKLVQLGAQQGSQEEREAYYEHLYARTDIFNWSGGRPAGIPIFFPVACMLALLGWCRLGAGRFQEGWNWVGVRIGGLLGLIMSQAPYGTITDAYMYLGWPPSSGQIPILEAMLAVAIKLAELWPSGVVTF